MEKSGLRARAVIAYVTSLVSGSYKLLNSIRFSDVFYLVIIITFVRGVDKDVVVNVRPSQRLLSSE